MSNIVEPKENLEAAFRDSYKLLTGKRNLYVAFIDANAMKFVNDTHGHLVGDKVLMALSSCIAVAARKVDRVIRFGGDEFVLFLPNISETKVRKLAATIQGELNNNEFLINTIGGLSVSIGIVKYNEQEHGDMTDVLKAADELMYMAKANPPNFCMIDKDMNIKITNEKRSETTARKRSYFSWIVGTILKEQPTTDKRLLMSVAREIWNKDDSSLLNVNAPNETVKNILSHYAHELKRGA